MSHELIIRHALDLERAVGARGEAVGSLIGVVVDIGEVAADNLGGPVTQAVEDEVDLGLVEQAREVGLDELLEHTRSPAGVDEREVRLLVAGLESSERSRNCTSSNRKPSGRRTSRRRFSRSGRVLSKRRR